LFFSTIIVKTTPGGLGAALTWAVWRALISLELLLLLNTFELFCALGDKKDQNSFSLWVEILTLSSWSNGKVLIGAKLSILTT